MASNSYGTELARIPDEPASLCGSGIDDRVPQAAVIARARIESRSEVFMRAGKHGRLRRSGEVALYPALELGGAARAR